MKAKELLTEFLREKTTTEKATALAGVCSVVGYTKGKTEIIQILNGDHKLSRGIPLLTLERFLTKYRSSFGNQTLNVRKTHKTHSVITIDKIISNIQVKLYEIHARILSGEYQ